MVSGAPPPVRAESEDTSLSLFLGGFRSSAQPAHRGTDVLQVAGDKVPVTGLFLMDGTFVVFKAWATGPISQ